MNIAKRQISILYELAFSYDYLSYDYFKNLLYITEKTIREDIKTINYYYKNNNIYIKYKKGYGFILSGSDKDKTNLRIQLESIYTDVFDIEYNYSTYTAQIIEILYEYNGKISLNQIANILNLSNRTITKLLIDVRQHLEKYNCKLVTKPRYGFVLIGNEIHQRMMFANNLQNRNNQADNVIFTSENKYEKVKEIIKDYLNGLNVSISQVGLEKMISYIFVSNYRIQKNQICICTEMQEKLGIELMENFQFKKFIKELESLYLLEMPNSEQIMLCIIFANCFSLENFIENDKFSKQTNMLYSLIVSKLYDIGFYNKKNNGNFDQFIFPLIKKAVLVNEYDIIDHFYSAFSRKTIKSSVLSCNIAFQIYDYLNQEIHIDNLCIYWQLCFAVYSYIRSISVTKKLNSVALYTPYSKIYGESLKRRVLNRWKEIIKTIDVVDLSDLQNNTFKYDCILYCDCANPLKDMEISSLKVNYYFTNQDVRNFYEEIFIPSHIYHRAFGKVNIEDYYVDYHYKGIEEIKKILYISAKSDDVRKEIERIEINSFIMHNGVLNITLYCRKQNQAFSKLFFLDSHVSENGYRFNRVFVHCIALRHDLYAIRTTEKVMRNIVDIDDTTNVIAQIPYLDFYEYYIGNSKTLLQSIESKK